MSLQQTSWITVVATCVIATIVLALTGYTGYSIVIAAVGGAAAVNLV